MSGQSILKKDYDKYAARYFISKGWKSCVVDKRGRYCDVLAVRGNVVAVIEVKSPAEQSAVKAYDDTKGLSRDLRNQFPEDFASRRRFVMDSITYGLGIGLVKLYAVTLACQLFRYVYEYHEKVSYYRKAIGNKSIPLGSIVQCESYLVIPIEAKEEGKYALNHLKEMGILAGFIPDESSRLYVAKVVYS